MTANVLILSFIFALIIAVMAFLGFKRKLFTEGYSALWLSQASVLFLLILFPEKVKQLSVVLGFQTNTSLLFLSGIVFLMAVVVIMSMHISKARRQIIQLTQNIAILQASQSKNNEQPKDH